MPLDQNKILEFISDELAIDCSDVRGDTFLFSSGLIDSFSLVSLMSFIEREQRIMIAPREINLDNFDTIERILAFLKNVSDRGEKTVFPQP